MVKLDSAILPAINILSATIAEFNTYPYTPGFNVKNVVNLAQTLPTHSWEFGTSAEALLELHNPELSVFGETPFPVLSLPQSQVKALAYAAKHTDFGAGYAALSKGNGASGDPASLGVSAVMLGKTEPKFATAANETVDGLLNDVPRYWNGAISHRANYAELWADFMYMVPPFLAYYAADKEDVDLLQTSVKQCQLYRQILQSNNSGALDGVWMHIQGPQSEDTGFWSTGNAWAAAGMSRVLATVTKAPFISDLPWRTQAIGQLTQYIKEIVDGVMKAPMDNGLLRNYLNDVSGSGHGFGEISGSSLIAATIYRMAVLQPDSFGADYVAFADGIRATLSGNDKNDNSYITSEGTATPAVNPMAWKDTTPFTKGSPEGQAFVVLMYAGWRDCVNAKICSAVSPSIPSTPVTKRSTHSRLRRHMAGHSHGSA
ncbi:hypothetical protein BDN70DRAFT_403644 [Pholiota conissans]|uniref:Glycoside hydrolase family 105 protein n=1 Tax=Pholiota conissans TaxID=109636 RepID=A0A9P6CXA1_9AGAR|nr:hypothetical protein BDN70DRAFT_403644 [Pholiota conissans]